jgi:hypothetical protein
VRRVSAMQRRKGASYEREVCGVLSDSLGRVVTRNLGQARDGGDDITLGRFRIECKRRNRIASEAFLKQCEACCKPGETPLVVLRGDGGESMVLMRLADFLPLLGNELAPAETECDHNWIDMRNEVITDGWWCLKCNAILSSEEKNKGISE